MKHSIQDQQTKISIITIVYNNVTGLKRTIESVVEQTYSNIEFIVIDGGSNDGTVELIKNNTDNISLWISEKDDGIADAFNKGLARITGDLVFFLNSGDAFIDVDVVFNVVDEWNKNPVDILFYKVQVTDKIYIPSNCYRDNEKKIWKMADVPHQGAFIKSEIFKNIGGFNINYDLRMDFEFFARCNLYKCTHHYISQVIVSYEAGGKSMTSSNRKKFWKEGMSIKYLYNIPLTYKDVVKAVLYR